MCFVNRKRSLLQRTFWAFCFVTRHFCFVEV